MAQTQNKENGLVETSNFAQASPDLDDDSGSDHFENFEVMYPFSDDATQHMCEDEDAEVPVARQQRTCRQGI